MYQQKKYIQFLIKSTNQHGVHSPFIFDVITKCFYNKTNYTDYQELKAYRNALLKNKETILITDLGSGSKKTNKTERCISELARTAGTPLKRAQLGYRLTQYFKPEHILELGTSLGIATQAMHLGHPKTQITTIEGCSNVSKFTQAALTNYNNIQFLTGDFSKHLKNVNQQSWDCIFFDGNHTKQATLNYFETLLPAAHNDTIFIFDDIYWSKGMTEAWEIIKQHPQVTATIDTFLWGFVFFRKEQGKEHFTIRV